MLIILTLLLLALMIGYFVWVTTILATYLNQTLNDTPSPRVITNFNIEDAGKLHLPGVTPP